MHSYWGSIGGMRNVALHGREGMQRAGNASYDGRRKKLAARVIREAGGIIPADLWHRVGRELSKQMRAVRMAHENQRIHEIVQPASFCAWCVEEQNLVVPAKCSSTICDRHRALWMRRGA